ncbi:LysR family transcriptional regulator [Eubacterium multiforme]|uniref:DNA-binding transcriptional LysR family regulator n=1 Tax=Eubacterium multiforme TaxID=83339 RepID=A0ABT9UW48_9FIRM|nr:LysR family transcriptional regulator [Eubacterium multiforme]MDQ0150537.1 DNA-binding transcriptional LysR family regulator [Eubacterium multiforme]
MNLQQLEYFKMLAETKNFTIASSKLLITQPALSKSILKLEKELEIDLFEREGRNIKITESGEVFLKYVELALFNIEKGIEEINNIQKNNERKIIISSTECIGSTFVPFILSDFLNKNPDVKFQFDNGSTLEILNSLNKGDIDLAFFDDINFIDNYPELKAVLVKKEKYVLIVPKGHRLSNRMEVSLKELKEESFIILNNNLKNKRISYSELIGYTPKISVEPNKASMLMGLVSAGAGITIVPYTPSISTSKISIINIKEDIGYKTIYMAWNKEKCKNNTIKDFRDYIINKKF